MINVAQVESDIKVVNFAFFHQSHHHINDNSSSLIGIFTLLSKHVIPFCTLALFNNDKYHGYHEISFLYPSIQHFTPFTFHFNFHLKISTFHSFTIFKIISFHNENTFEPFDSLELSMFYLEIYLHLFPPTL